MDFNKRDAIWKYIKNYFINYSPNITCIKEKCDKKHVKLFKKDTLEVALGLKNPLVLILADNCTPGGCVDSGNGMQEESLFRRTGLFKHMLPEFYPILNDECLYIPSVPVIFHSEEFDYKKIIPIKYMSFIACPGIKHIGQTFTKNEQEILINKIKLIFKTAKKYNHSEIVLGALGCGVWNNPPKEVAIIFKKVIEQETNLNIYFAILGKNYNIFNDIFNE